MSIKSEFLKSDEYLGDSSDAIELSQKDTPLDDGIHLKRMILMYHLDESGTYI